MTPEITRSAGLVAIEGQPWIVGGGYSGSTKELDDTVQKAARLLSKGFGRDVEIRFNSDRLSGGAWLKDDLPGFAGNTQVGLTAGIGAVPPKGKSRDQWIDELGKKYNWERGMDEELHNAPQGVFVSTYISADVADDQGVVNSGNPGHRYASHEHKSLTDGLTFLKKHVNRSKLNPYKETVLGEPRQESLALLPRQKSSKKRLPRVREHSATLRGLRR